MNTQEGADTLGEVPLDSVGLELHAVTDNRGPRSGRQHDNEDELKEADRGDNDEVEDDEFDDQGLVSGRRNPANRRRLTRNPLRFLACLLLVASGFVLVGVLTKTEAHRALPFGPSR
jgi:hypothetical protein